MGRKKIDDPNYPLGSLVKSHFDGAYGTIIGVPPPSKRQDDPYKIMDEDGTVWEGWPGADWILILREDGDEDE